MAKKRKNSNYKPKATVQAPVQESRRSGTTKLSTRAKILLPVSAVLLIAAYILSSKANSGEGTMAIVSYALMALGYSRSEAAAALGGLEEGLSTEEYIKKALKKLF